jgi:hypothetical protein
VQGEIDIDVALRRSVSIACHLLEDHNEARVPEDCVKGLLLRQVPDKPEGLGDIESFLQVSSQPEHVDGPARALGAHMNVLRVDER